MTLAESICDGCYTDLHKGSDGKNLVGGVSRVIGVEYDGRDPEHYDGVSEWRCPDCGRREGRWSGKVLKDGESEPRFGGRR